MCHKKDQLTFAVFPISDFLCLVWCVARHTVLTVVTSCIVLASLANSAPWIIRLQTVLWKGPKKCFGTYETLLPSNFLESNLHLRACRLQLHSKVSWWISETTWKSRLTDTLIWMSFGSSFPRPIVVKGHALVAGFSFGPMLALANGLSVLNQATKRKSYLSENCFLVFPQKKSEQTVPKFYKLEHQVILDALPLVHSRNNSSSYRLSWFCH